MPAYVKRRSWHVIAKVDALGWRTRCGLVINEEAPVSDVLMSAEKSCENCLRALARDNDRRDKLT